MVDCAICSTVLTRQDTALLLVLVHHAGPPNRPTAHSLLQDFASDSLAKLAFGLASVGYDDTELYSAITLAAAEDLNNMSPADVSMILWACGEQGHLCDKFMSGA
jgi:hypothetical protein